MKNKIENIVKNPYFIIVSVYILAHFFMLILSGCWWDDWTFMFGNIDYINAVALESGRPEWSILIPLCISLTNHGRILIFFLYLCNSIFVYRILLNSQLFDEKASLCIALLFTVIPVNDARILVSNFTYTVGLFFFYLAFMLFVSWNRMEKSKIKIVYRIVILCLFFISFILNSILAYFYIIFAYLFVLDMRNNKENNFIKAALISIKNVLLAYPDFFIIPFVYYISNKTFFPTYGHVFDNYNAVSVGGILKSFLIIPKAVIKVFYNIATWCLSCLDVITIILIICLGLFVFLRSNNKSTNYKHMQIAEYFVYGLFILVVGLVPYVMVRGKPIDTIGAKGRDAVLVPFGAAIMLHSLIVIFKGKIRKTILVVLIGLGIVAFNGLYVEWQKDYYYQLSLEHLLDNSIVKNNDTFFLIELNETQVEAQRYYSLNANAVNVYGDESRLFIPKVSNLSIIENEKEMKTAKEELEYAHVMKDYNPEDLYFDAILDFSCNLSNADVCQLKFLEIFNKHEFIKRIEQNGKLDIYVVDDDFTQLLFKEYDKGNLQNDEDVLQLVLSYAQ